METADKISKALFKVIEAREKELQYVRDMGVWKKIPRRQAQARGWNVIKTRWIDINNGDDRSRLVGNESTTKF